MWQRLHRITGSVIPVAFGFAIATYFFVPYAIHCRAEARLTQCRNNLFQHSGSHGPDRVLLDGNLHVISVFRCPACSDPAGAIGYSLTDNGGQEWHIVPEDELPASVYTEAQRRLHMVKSKPRYQSIYHSWHESVTQ